MVSTVDIGKDEKLVFFESTNNTLCSGLVKKKWNGKWVVIAQGGELPFDSDGYYKDKEKPALNWMWSNMKEFGVSPCDQCLSEKCYP